MHFTSKISIALVAVLAAAGEARNHHGRFHRRGYGTNETDGAAAPTVLGTAAGSSVGNTTLVYTLGTGSSTSVVTTTIFQTFTRTDLHTVTAAPVSSGGVAPGSDANVDAADTDGPTTPTSSTSYTTTTVTVVRDTEGADSGAAPTAVAAGSGSSGCAAKATVTVTEKEMVTVTVSPTVDDESAATGSPSTVTVAPLPVTTSGPYANGTNAQSSSVTQYPSSGLLIYPSGYRH